MAGFNIIATLQLQGPVNVTPVVNALQNALKGVTANVNVTFNPNTNTAITNINSRLATMNIQLQAVAANATRAAAAISTMVASFNTASQANVNFNANITRGSQAVRQTVQGLGDATAGMDNFGRAAGLAGRRYSAFLIAGGGIVAIVNGIREAIAESAKFEREMIRIQQTGSATREEIRGISDNITRLSTNLGVSSRELAQSAVLFAAAGVKARDMEGALTSLAKASLSPSFGNMIDTTNGMIAISAQFRTSMGEMEAALGAVNAVSNEYSVEAKDIIDAVTRAGGAFRTAGGTLNEFIATFTSVRSTTRESAEGIATGLKTIFSNIQRADVVDNLRQLGVNLRYTRDEAIALGDARLTDQFVGPYQAVQRLSQALQGLRTTDPRYSGVAEQLGGVRQLGRVLPLLQETTRAQEAYNIAQSGQISLDINAQQAQEGMINKLIKLRENFLEMFRVLTGTPAFQAFVDTAFRLANAVAEIGKHLAPLMPLLIGFATIKLSQSIGTFIGGAIAGATGRGPTAVGPRGYATGGVVPGIGDTDSVPAYLMPGEFVVRKEAAQKIGYGPLSQMNRYAGGGRVIVPVDGPYGGLFLGGKEASRATASASKLSSEVFTNVMAPGKNGGLSYPMFNIVRKALEVPSNSSYVLTPEGKGLVLKDGNKRVPGAEIDVAFVGHPSQYFLRDKSVKSAITNSVGQGISYTVSDITKELKDTFTITPSLYKSNISKSGYNNIKGAYFEGLLTSAAGVSVGTGKEYFDIRKGVSPESAKYFENNAGATPNEQLLDVKATASSSSLSSLVQKAISEKGKEGNANIKLGFGQTSIDDIAEAKAAFETYNNAKTAAIAGTPVKKKASGGSITDTVPALLTPGEFVVNRDAVSRIGLSSLEHMNSTGRMRGFAHGGFVHMANGGPTPPVPVAVPQGGRAVTFANLERFTAGDPAELGKLHNNVVSALTKEFQIINSRLNPQQAAKLAADKFQQMITHSAEVQRIEADAIAVRSRITLGTTLLAQAQAQGQTATAKAIAGQLVIYEEEHKTLTAELGAMKQRHQLVVKTVDGERQILGSLGIQQQIASGNITTPVPRTLGGRLAGIGSSLLSSARQAGPTAALLAVPYITQALEGVGGEAKDAVGPTGSPTGFKVARASAGLLSGAATGAALGSTLGPYGALAGALIGATVGVVGAWKDAEKEIRAVKLATALTEFRERLQGLSSGTTNPNPVLSASIMANIAQAREQSAGTIWERGGRSNFNLARLSPLGANYNANTFESTARAVQQENFGQDLPQITQTLNRFAGDIGRANPNITTNAAGGAASPQEIRANLDRLQETLRTGNAGMNEEFINLISNLRRIPRSEVIREFGRVIEENARNERVRQAELGQRRDTERATAYFTGLVLATEQARDSLVGLEQGARLLDDRFNGTMTAIKVQSLTDPLTHFGGPDRGAFNLALGAVTAPFGAAGTQLRDTSSALNAVEEILPSAIANAISSTPLNQQQTIPDVVLQTLRSRLGDSANQGTTQTIISSVVNALRREKPEELIERTRGGQIDGFIKQLLSGIRNPVQEALQGIAKQIEEASNNLVQGLNQYQVNLQKIGQQRDVVAGTQLNAQRFQAGLQAERAGRFGHGAELDFISLAQQQAPLQARQARLVGPNIGDDPEAIFERLQGVQRVLPGALNSRESALRQQGPNSEAFRSGAENVARLQAQNTNLIQALRNLENATERNAAVQERLAELNKERDARGSLAETIARGDPEAINRLGRGAALAVQATSQQGAIRGFTPEDRALTFDFLNSAREIDIPGLGGRRGADIARDLALQFAPFLNQTADQNAQRADLQGQITNNNDLATRAGELIATSMETANNNFLTNLEHQQSRLYAALERNVLTQQRTAEESNRIRVQGERSALQPRVDARNLLSQRLGVTTQDQVNSLRGGESQIGALATQLQNVRTIREAQEGLNLQTHPGSAQDLTATMSRFAARGGADNETQIRDFFRQQLNQLVGTQAGPANAARAYELYLQGINRLGGGGIARRPNEGEVARTSLNTVLEGLRGEVEGGALTRARAGVTNVFRGGPLPANITDRLEALLNDRNGATPQRLQEIVGMFTGNNNEQNSIERLARNTGELETQAGTAADNIERLAAAIAALPAIGGNTVQARAAGGSIFAPRGTDTVPAMLTPGEFVVNRAATERHFGLLRAINDGYMVDGGIVAQYLAVGGGTFHNTGSDDVLNRRRLRNSDLALGEAASPGGFSAISRADVEGQRTGRRRGGQEIQDLRGYRRRFDNVPGSQAILARIDRTIINRENRLLTSTTSDAGTTAGIAAGYRGEAVTQGRQSLLNLISSGPGLAPGQDLQYQLSSNILGIEQRGNVDALNEFRNERGNLGQLNTNVNNANEERNRRRAELGLPALAAGGVVPGHLSGIDTVPALLSGGEYVMSRNATGLLGVGNLNRFNRFAQGGYVGVNYLANGGVPIPGENNGVTLSIPGDLSGIIGKFNDGTSLFNEAVTRFVDNGLTQMTKAISDMSGLAGQFSQAFDKIPKSIELHMPAPINAVVSINGAEALSSAMEPFKDLAIKLARQEIIKAFDERLQGAGRPTFNDTSNQERPTAVNYA